MTYTTFAIAVTAILVAGCTKKQMISSQLADPATRKEDLEASMQLMDAHPEYLPDVYAAAKGHLRTLDAMLTLATADMNDPAMAKMVAAQVAIHPEVVERLVLDAVDVAKKSPRARAAIDKAIGERADATADMMADDPPAMAALVKAVIKVIETRPRAREAVMRAMRDGSPELVKMTVKDAAR